MVNNWGTLAGFDERTGEMAWSVDIMKEFGEALPCHHFCYSPLVVGETLVMRSGVVLDRKTGKVLWKNDALKETQDGHNNGSPGLIVLGGKTYVMVQHAEGKSDPQIVIYDPADGKVQLTFPQDRGCGGLHTEATAFDGGIWAWNQVFRVEDGKAVKSATIQPVTKGGDPKRSNSTIANPSMFTPVIHQRHLYGMVPAWESFAVPALDNLVCVDLTTGREVWKQEGAGGPMILAGDKLAILQATGELIVAEASPKGYKELARAKVFLAKGKEADFGGKKVMRYDGHFTLPTFSRGRIYCRVGDTISCLYVSGK